MPNGSPSVAIVLHLFYEEQWPELSALLRQVRQDCTLFVTVQEPAVADMVHADFPGAIVRPVPNLGRDILPFVALLPELLGFDLVCKLHTKRSSAQFRPWQLEALRGVLGGPDLVDRIVGAFAQRPELMMAGSEATFVGGWRHMFGSEQGLRELQPDLPRAFGFFAGTMFWSRPQLFADFADLLPAGRFVPHTNTVAELEHAVERLFGVRVASLGGSVGLTRISRGVPSLDVVAATKQPRVRSFGSALPKKLAPRYADYPADWYVQPDLVSRTALGVSRRLGLK